MGTFMPNPPGDVFLFRILPQCAIIKNTFDPKMPPMRAIIELLRWEPMTASKLLMSASTQMPVCRRDAFSSGHVPSMHFRIVNK